jgi:hypothetical protein
MTNNSAVLNGAYYGNESWRAAFQDARDAEGEALDPRKGAFGYVFDYSGIDGCVIQDLSDENNPTSSFDSDCLEALAAGNDPKAVAGAPGNVASNVGLADLPAFEATQGTLSRQDGVAADTTLAHVGGPDSRFPEWGGGPLKDPEASISLMRAPLDEELVAGSGIPDPVDLILRGFRAYFPLNFPGSGRNQNAVFGQTIKPGVDIFKTQNPFGRGHSAGCTSCHMKYNFDGTRDAQIVSQIVDDERVDESIVDPTTKHREFDAKTQDIQQIGGESRLVGMAVTTAEREFSNVADQDQQRFYSANHSLTTQIGTEVCSLCHAFVTRVDLAYTGMSEEEQRDDLSRRKAIEFTTPDGDQVKILDSWIREETIDAETNLIVPDGVAVIESARERDAALAALGLFPGNGGCAPSVFTEDCNNNGRLDRDLILQRVDVDGKVLAEAVIDEDDNNNGVLDLVDRLPRENSLDGRQVRYIYGGANGATRLMDIHYERGMHCIDCHQLQDSHGDGHLYGTNHEAIEIECDDCHGSLSDPATLRTSGANGGNLMSLAVDNNGRPFFENKGGRIIQHSRVTPGLSWVVPQLPDTINAESPGFNARADISHSPFHLPASATDENGYTSGSLFTGAPGASPLQTAKLECYSCHTSWVLNCMGCHDNSNLGDLVRKKLNADGTIEQVAGENEVWFNNSNQAAATNFQLLSFFRSPFVLGTAASADAQRVAPFRSSMIVHASINDAQGTLFDNLSFTTFQEKDANSGRANVATSGAAMNQTMPHTVRPNAVRSCEQCHSLVDQEGRVRNDHILGETMGLGANRYGYLGDWAMMAGTGGIKLFEYKQENQFPGSGGSSRFPGIIINGLDRVDANVEPILNAAGVDATDVGTDIVLIRNFNPTPVAPGLTAPPTLRDLSVSSHSDGTLGTLLVTDITSRGHPTAGRVSVGIADTTFVLNLTDVANALAHISPDVSDPFVYVANGVAGLTVVRINDAPTAGVDAAEILATTAIPSGASAIEVVLAGDIAYVGTDAGTVEVFNLDDPALPVHVTSFSVDPGVVVNGLAVGAFTLYAATSGGLAVMSIASPLAPATAAGAAAPLVLPGFDFRELSLASGHAYLAAGTDGVLDVDVTTPANPVVVQELVATFAAAEVVDAQDVVVSLVPGQQWILAADASGDLLGFKLDNTLPTKERCFPDPRAANCGLDMDFRDPTVSGRDPSFDPVMGAFDPDDPSGVPFFRQTSADISSGRRLARPAYWEKINTQTGRRMRDSFMPGAGVLSLDVMQRMYGVLICEDTGSVDVNGNGLGDLGFASPEFLATGTCETFGQESAAARAPAPGEICRSGFSFNAVLGRCMQERAAQ